jgi:hypothetical protein
MLHMRDGEIEFVHQSAKDYLLRDHTDNDPVLDEFRIRPEKAHLHLTQRCLQSLAEKTYLQYYSLLNWPKHARNLKDLASHLFEQEISFFGEGSLLREAWWRKYCMNFPGLPNVVPPRLHMACFIGLEKWTRAILLEEIRSGNPHKVIVAEECSSGWLALDYAAEGGAGDLLELLLDDKLERKHPPNYLGFALRRAVSTQRAGAVEILLSRRADANTTDLEGKSLLQCAQDLENRTIRHFLLDYGAKYPVVDYKALESSRVVFPASDATILLEQKSRENLAEILRDGLPMRKDPPEVLQQYLPFDNEDHTSPIARFLSLGEDGTLSVSANSRTLH